MSEVVKKCKTCALYDGDKCKWQVAKMPFWLAVEVDYEEELYIREMDKDDGENCDTWIKKVTPT